MQNPTALILFLKAPQLGKVKTRLAKDVGDQKALIVYEKLLKHTLTVAQESLLDVFVFVKGEEFDELKKYAFKIEQQTEGGLGDKMLDAFCKVSRTHQKIIIVGSDCPSLSVRHLEQAVEALRTSEVVLGPAFDGGYYLLGSNGVYRDLFRDKSWSTPELLKETTDELRTKEVSYTLLRSLSDIDTLEDLKQFPNFFVEKESEEPIQD